MAGGAASQTVECGPEITPWVQGGVLTRHCTSLKGQVVSSSSTIEQIFSPQLFCSRLLPGILEPLYLFLLSMDCRSPAWKLCPASLSEHYVQGAVPLGSPRNCWRRVCTVGWGQQKPFLISKQGNLRQWIKPSSEITLSID